MGDGVRERNGEGGIGEEDIVNLGKAEGKEGRI